jgi:TatD DNase family protein
VWIDTHAHLDDEQFAGDLAAVLDRARAAGLDAIVTVATSLASTRAALTLSRQHSFLFPTAGIHPNHAFDVGRRPGTLLAATPHRPPAGAAPGDWDEIVSLVEQEPRIVGLGETGLDRHWHDTPFPQQEEYFVRHLELARRTGRPVVIHCREAEADMQRVLREQFDRHGPIRGVMHSFTGGAELARACLEMGLHLSFAGMLTYKKAAGLREVAATVPLDRVLVETDSPYLSPVPLRGKRNEPAHVIHTGACLAGLHGLSAEALAAYTTRNARALFGLA